MRYKCVVSYVGDHYEGWQSQTRGTSVQEQIEKVLECEKMDGSNQCISPGRYSYLKC